MPTPFGHTLAALSIAGAARPYVAAPALPYYGLAAVLGCVPDADLLPVLLMGVRTRIHQGPTHSFVFAAAVALLVSTIAVRRARRLPVFLLSFAYIVSHFLLDALRPRHSPTAGLQLLWPFSERRFSLPWRVFHHAPNLEEFMLPGGIQHLFRNLETEAVILGPILLLTFGWRWLVTRRELAVSGGGRQRISHRGPR